MQAVYSGALVYDLERDVKDSGRHINASSIAWCIGVPFSKGFEKIQEDTTLQVVCQW